MRIAGYRRLLSSATVRRLAAAYVALGLANTMTPVAFVLFAHAATGSFAIASLVLAASTAGVLVFGPARGRLVDRLGARSAVLLLLVPDLATDGGFVAAGDLRVAAGLLVGLAFLGGAVTAPASVALRSAWAEAFADRQERHVGYALMAVLQETNFIVGPLLAGILIELSSPTVPVAAIALLSFAGATLFAAAAPDAKTTRTGERGRMPALAGSGIRTVVATAAAFGLTFGILDVTFPAIARASGSPATAGILLSAFAAGAWIGALLYGSRPSQRTAGERYPGLCLLAAAGLAPLILTPPLPAMVAFAVLAGLCFAPITNCQLAVIDEVAQPSHKAEAFAWLGALYSAGLALGAALAGQLITAAGSRPAIAAACLASALAWLLATARARTLLPAAVIRDQGGHGGPLPDHERSRSRGGGAGGDNARGDDGAGGASGAGAQ